MEPSTDEKNLMENLERSLAELEALQAIYGQEDCTILSRSAHEAASSLVEQQNNHNGVAATLDKDGIESLQVKLKISMNNDNLNSSLQLQCSLPLGYPEHSAAQVFVSAISPSCTVNKKQQQEWTDKLKRKAESLLGQEAVMELVQELQDLAHETMQQQQTLTDTNESSANQEQKDCFSRRWIWCHHFTNTDRIKSIVTEARNLQLGGYVKPGYPGIVVVEGPSPACDEFCTWIKGNKSRPGGFGRNWGHHVRGQVDYGLSNGKAEVPLRLPMPFEELDDNMKTLGALCKEKGLEQEFLEYVMQHKVVS